MPTHHGVVRALCAPFRVVALYDALQPRLEALRLEPVRRACRQECYASAPMVALSVLQVPALECSAERSVLARSQQAFGRCLPPAHAPCAPGRGERRDIVQCLSVFCPRQTPPEPGSPGLPGGKQRLALVAASGQPQERLMLPGTLPPRMERVCHRALRGAKRYVLLKRVKSRNPLGVGDPPCVPSAPHAELVRTLHSARSARAYEPVGKCALHQGTLLKIRELCSACVERLPQSKPATPHSQG